ncbi:ATP-binding cassette domain-containing protein [Actinomadura keratinilytica]|jgi:ABC-2 type transport system ATP-binding protein|uniref:ABC transporter domain-containing protein n=1 Tax=Actinomadura keratinilytica TaxID=547461 RepID=A0ABP7YV96_9ACTN
MDVIEVRGLRVRFGERDAVRDVSFTVARGEVYALLGRHGAGKTTLLEAAAGLRRPCGGTVRVCGIDPYERRGALRAGTVWRDGGLFPGLTVAEVVDAWRRWTLDPLTAAGALRLAGLSGLEDVPFERLTPGERRLLDVALVLLARSDVLFLDEPTADLGEASGERVWGVLRALSAQGVTVLAATRAPDEARRADRVGILDDGRLVTGGDQTHPKAA